MGVYPGRKPGDWRVTAPKKGKQIERAFKGSKAGARRYEAQLRLEVDARPCSEARAGTTLAQLVVRYSEHAKRRLGRQTCRVRTSQLANVLEAMGEVKLHELTSAHFEAYQDSRIDDGVESSTINNECRVLKTVLRWAGTQGHEVGCCGVKPLKQTKERPRAFTEPEVQALYSSARVKARHFVPILIWLANTGMRRGEAIAARWEWIDWSADMIRIPATRYWKPKSGKPRDVPIGDAVRTLLQARRERGPIFETRNGGAYACWPKDMWERTRDHAGIEGGVHQLRHTFASHYLANGGTIDVLAELLGHSTTRTTELYAHLLPGRLECARNVVNLAPKLKALDTVLDKPGHERESTVKQA